MKKRLGIQSGAAFRSRIYTFLLLLFLMQGESGCRVQAGNPQTTKPIKPGNVTVALADAPVDDFSNLYVTVRAVAFAPGGTGRCLRDPRSSCADSSLYYFDLNKETEVDLLSLSDGKTQVLPFAANLPAGTYEGLRLFMTQDSEVEGVSKSTGERVRLDFPVGPFGQKEFTIIEEFDVEEDSENEIIIHVDLRRSVIKLPDGRYAMKPMIHVVPSKIAARIYGSVGDPSVTRICAYILGGSRRHNKLNVKQFEPVGQFQRHLPAGAVNVANVFDTTSSCDRAEAIGDVKNGGYDLRYLPPVNYLLRVFKSDGSSTDTPMYAPLRPQESRVVDL
ncbi:MAG: hypothetical protein RLZZ488_1505 [Pseudomonadota bacterium]